MGRASKPTVLPLVSRSFLEVPVYVFPILPRFRFSSVFFTGGRLCAVSCRQSTMKDMTVMMRFILQAETFPFCKYSKWRNSNNDRLDSSFRPAGLTEAARIRNRFLGSSTKDSLWPVNTMKRRVLLIARRTKIASKQTIFQKSACLYRFFQP